MIFLWPIRVVNDIIVKQRRVAWIILGFTIFSAFGLAVNSIWLLNESLQAHKVLHNSLKPLLKYLAAVKYPIAVRRLLAMAHLAIVERLITWWMRFRLYFERRYWLM